MHDDKVIRERFRVLIAGGGVAGVEAVLALRELAHERIATTLLAPEPEFVVRPLRVWEPEAGRAPLHLPLATITQDAGAELVADALSWVDAELKVAHTKAGRQLPYDALLLALGARPHPRFRHADTFDDRHLLEQFRELIEGIDSGRVDRLGFVVPSRMPWPFPIYELALMTARHTAQLERAISITVITPEDAPLALFGTLASGEVAALLAEHGIETVLSAHAETPAPGQVAIHPSGRTLHFDRVMALPELFGPGVPGVPTHDGFGFIPIDVHCSVPGLDDVYGAGDATDFPVKQGEIAAHQACVAARAIAAGAGADVKPVEFHPVVHGILLGAERPLYLAAHITGGHGSSSEARPLERFNPAEKMTARYLGPYLKAHQPLQGARSAA